MNRYLATEYRGNHGAFVTLRHEKWGASWRWYYADSTWTHREVGPIRSKFRALLDYANRRLERCLFGDAKPTCANCVVHCYRADMRERMREVMRWAGPRMTWRHPVLTLFHFLDRFRSGGFEKKRGAVRRARARRG